MRAMMIDDEVEAEIKAAVARARKKPTPLELLKAAAVPAGDHLKLSDRPPGWKPVSRAEQVEIPHGYRAAVSFEHQPEPFGLSIHLSVSVDAKGRLPSQGAFEQVCNLFDLEDPKIEKMTKIWIEEFDPGHEAVNIVQRWTK